MSRMFIPLSKVDASQRLVYGQIDETPDRSGEVFDYTSSKPYFVKWSEDIRDATKGKSVGNVRAMHGSVAAGKLEDIAFDDASKSIQLCARIIDDAEWLKVEQGVYTGFSPGGRYIKRWEDGELTRYTAQPVEISIVDLPCIPSASFTMIKAGGVVEQVPFKRLRKDDDGDSSVTYTEDQLAELFGSLDWMWQSGDWEEEWSVNGQPMPEELKTWLEEGSALVQGLIGDGSASDDDADGDETMAASARARRFRKVGNRNSKDDLARIQLIHDTSVELGASCGGEAVGADKSLGHGNLIKMHNDMAKLASERDALKKRVGELEALPSAGGPVLKAVDKGHDVAQAIEQNEAERIASLPNGLEKSLAMIKLAHRNPQVVRF